MYQSIPRLTIPSPGNIFDGRIPYSPGKRKFKTPTPRAYKNVLKPHPGAFFSNIYCENVKKMRQKLCKTASFYNV